MAAELRDHTAASCSSWAPAPISIKTINASFYCSLTYIDTESLFFTEIYAIKKKKKRKINQHKMHTSGDLSYRNTEKFYNLEPKL